MTARSEGLSIHPYLEKRPHMSQTLRAMVTGGGGFLGSKIVSMLLAEGCSVRHFSRNEYPELKAQGVMCHRGNLADRGRFPTRFKTQMWFSCCRKGGNMGVTIPNTMQPMSPVRATSSRHACAMASSGSCIRARPASLSADATFATLTRRNPFPKKIWRRTWPLKPQPNAS